MLYDGDFSQHGSLECVKLGLKELQENIHSVKISADGEYVAFGMGNGCIKIYDTNAMKQKERTMMGVPFDGLPTTCVRWSPLMLDDKHYVIGNVNSVGGMFTWVWEQGAEFLERHMRHAEEKNDSCALEFSPDGKSILTAGSDRNIRMYDFETKKLTNTLSKGLDDEGHLRTAHANRIFSLRYVSPTTVVSAGWQSPIQVWDLRTGRSERQVAGAHPASDCLEIIPGSTRFFCCSQRPQKQLQMFDFVSGKEIVEESNKLSAACDKSIINCITYRPETDTIWIAAAKPDAILCVNSVTGALKGKVPVNNQIMSVDSSPHMPNRVFAGTMKETVYIVEQME